jgi:hypothetical protein
VEANSKEDWAMEMILLKTRTLLQAMIRTTHIGAFAMEKTSQKFFTRININALAPLKINRYV